MWFTQCNKIVRANTLRFWFSRTFCSSFSGATHSCTTLWLSITELKNTWKITYSWKWATTFMTFCLSNRVNQLNFVVCMSLHYFFLLLLLPLFSHSYCVCRLASFSIQKLWWLNNKKIGMLCSISKMLEENNEKKNRIVWFIYILFLCIFLRCTAFCSLTFISLSVAHCVFTVFNVRIFRCLLLELNTEIIWLSN